jgi:hypothetical protein
LLAGDAGVYAKGSTMRIVLPLPDGWKQLAGSSSEDERAASSPDLPMAPQLMTPLVEPRISVRAGEMIPFPIDGDSWIEGVLGAELSPGGRLVVQKRAPNQTVTGYPIQIIYSDIIDDAGQILEARMTALYAMLSHNGSVVMRVRRSDDARDTREPAELLTRYEEPVKTLFRAATPDFQTGLCTLSALYEGLPGLWERK